MFICFRFHFFAWLRLVRFGLHNPALLKFVRFDLRFFLLWIFYLPLFRNLFRHQLICRFSIFLRIPICISTRSDILSILSGGLLCVGLLSVFASLSLSLTVAFRLNVLMFSFAALRLISFRPSLSTVL